MGKALEENDYILKFLYALILRFTSFLEISLGLKALFCILLPPNTTFMLFQLGAVFSHGLTKSCYFWHLAL